MDQVKDMEKAAGDKVGVLDTQEMPAIMMGKKLTYFQLKKQKQFLISKNTFSFK